MAKKAPPLTYPQQQTVERHTRLVYAFVLARWPAGVGPLSYDDLCQAGMVGLMRAAQLYDASRGTQFSTYATPWIWQAVSHEIRRSCHMIRRPGDGRGSEKKLPVLQVLSVDTVDRHGDSQGAEFLAVETADPVDGAASLEAAGIVRDLLRCLDPRSRKVVWMRRMEGASLREVGRAVGLSREFVRRVEVEAVNKVRRVAFQRMPREFDGPPVDDAVLVRTPCRARPCAECGEPFRSKNLRQLCCSRRCGSRRFARLKKEESVCL